MSIDGKPGLSSKYKVSFSHEGQHRNNATYTHINNSEKSQIEIKMEKGIVNGGSNYTIIIHNMLI